MNLKVGDVLVDRRIGQGLIVGVVVVQTLIHTTGGTTQGEISCEESFLYRGRCC